MKWDIYPSIIPDIHDVFVVLVKFFYIFMFMSAEETLTENYVFYQHYVQNGRVGHVLCCSSVNS